MKIEIKVDESLIDKEIIINTPELDQETYEIKFRIENSGPQILTGAYNNKIELIDHNEIIRIYAADKKVFTTTRSKTYQMRIPLYQIEEKLDPKKFVRISNSEIINLDKTLAFELSYGGTISCEMENGDICFISRRAMKKVKQILGV